MAADGTACPANSFPYNSTLCACDPGYYFAAGGRNCTLSGDGGVWVVRTVGVDESPSWFVNFLNLDAIHRFTQSQAVFLWATLLALVLWLLFCLLVRFPKLKSSNSVWFLIRWWISRLDACYATKHWLDDQKVVLKRKTELGGTFSVASFILFTGLLAALLYQTITKSKVEVHKVRPANAPDLNSFINEMEFNITTISSMSCSHLRGLGTFVTGTPGFIDYRIHPLSTYGNFYCHNTSIGPTISLRCSNCQVPRGNFYIPWQFVDLPNDPATAVGFQFNLSVKGDTDDRHVNFVSGMVKSGGYMNDSLKTFRGQDINILKIHLIPQIFRNLHNLSLIQPIFHDFLPGSSFSDQSTLQASLQSPDDGIVNTTLYVRFLSEYIVEIENQSLVGPVSFLANVGGLYAISVGIFLYFLVQFEHKIKKLRNEDILLRRIRSRKRAQQHWDKLRKYVMYTWGRSNSDSTIQHRSSLIDSFHEIGSLCTTPKSVREDSVHFTKKANVPVETIALPETSRSCFASNTTVDGRQAYPEFANEFEVVGIKEEGKMDHSYTSQARDSSRPS